MAPSLTKRNCCQRILSNHRKFYLFLDILPGFGIGPTSINAEEDAAIMRDAGEEEDTWVEGTLPINEAYRLPS